MENEKMRQRAIEFGFISLLAQIDSQLQNSDLKALMQREFWSALDTDDFSLHSQKGKVTDLDWPIDYTVVDDLVKAKHQAYLELKQQQ